MLAGRLGGDERVLVRYRNRDIGERELEFIRSTIAAGHFAGRVELSQLICRAWGWRQPNGALREYACRDLLLRLQEWGYLEVPARTRPRPARQGPPVATRKRPRSDLPVELIPIAEIPISDAEADLHTLAVRPIADAERLGWRLHMQRYHYLGCRPLVGEHLLYAAFLDTELVALVGWAAAAFRVPAREHFIGWDAATKHRRLHLIANNVRFLVLPWVRVRNLASKVLATNLRRLAADWQQRWGHPVHLAETFVDTSRFRASCYRAANWRYLGQSAGRTKRGNRYLDAGSPKAIYIYELHRHARRRLCPQRLA